MQERLSLLATLQARHERLATGEDKGGRSWLAHEAILAHLDANRDHAMRDGWTECAVERSGGMGRLRLTGVAPGGGARSEYPDPA
jgi:hypothetical protein